MQQRLVLYRQATEEKAETVNRRDWSELRSVIEPRNRRRERQRHESNADAQRDVYSEQRADLRGRDLFALYGRGGQSEVFEH